MNTFHRPYPERDMMVQNAVGIVRQVSRHTQSSLYGRMIVASTDWSIWRRGSFSQVKPADLSRWKLVEPLGLTSFLIYRHDRLGD